jgi:hypothetical protein
VKAFYKSVETMAYAANKHPDYSNTKTNNINKKTNYFFLG